MKKAAYIPILGLMGLFFAVDFLAAALRAGQLNDMLSPVGAGISSAILFFVYFKTRKSHSVSISWLLFALACAARMAADVVWAAQTLRQSGYSSGGMMNVLYMLAGVLMLVAVAVFVLFQFRGWNGARLLLDAAMYSVCVVALVWIVLLDRSTSGIAMTLQRGVPSAVGIFADLVLAGALAVWALSAKSGPLFVWLVAAGAAGYALADLAYYYTHYYGGYDACIGVFRTGGLLLLAAGGLTERYTEKGGAISPGNMYRQTGAGMLRKHIKTGAVLLLPLLAMAVKGFVIEETLGYLAFVTLYKGLGMYFEAAQKNDDMLKKEQEINGVLESMVAERTKDLMYVNGSLSARNEQLVFLSSRDTLTGLYNRRYLMDWLEEQTAAEAAPVTVMYLDLDRFKVINDTYGHDMGDRVITEIAKRLALLQCEGSILARMGGDEFVLAYTGDCDDRAAAGLAQRIIEECSQNIYIGDYVFTPSICVGISVCPQDAGDAASLLKHADIALYHAKEQGPGRCAAFNLLIQKKTQKRHALEMQLNRDEIFGELSLHYQPQFAIPDDRLIGAEALLRWNSAELGAVPPSEFIPIAEETGRINGIGLWVLREAAAQAAEWNARYGERLPVGVNISLKQLNSTGLLEELRSMASRADFDPAWLDIEITESVALEGEYRLIQIFRLFKAIGMSVSIDDFGSGYSSIMSLKQYSFDRIKIAKEMIDSVTVSERTEQIVKAIVMMARSLGITVIAEGVETEEQYDKLAALGCAQIQGFYLGRPVPADEFEEMYLKPVQITLAPA